PGDISEEGGMNAASREIMKRVLITIAACLSLHSHAASAANGVPPAQEIGFDRIRQRDLESNLHFLASDSLRGRMSLDPGDTASINVLASEISKAGLEPLSKTGTGEPSYLQPIRVIEYQPDRQANFLALERGDDSKKWFSPDIVGGFRDDVDISGQLAFAGY